MSESRFTWSANRALLFAALILLFLGVAAVYADSARIEAARANDTATSLGNGADNRTELPASGTVTYRMYLPVVARQFACVPIPDASYGTVAIIPPPTNPPAAVHPDLNLAVRGYVRTTGYLGLIKIEGPSDSGAPQLYTLFGDNRTPTFSAVYQVYDWDWVNNRRGAPIADPPVTLAGMIVAKDEILYVPASGYDIGMRATGYEVMVLYADNARVTLKYTLEDNVISGYTIHIENICIDPNLFVLYQTMNAAGRTRLPALYAGQGIGRAITTEIGVAIRDNGWFFDPRSQKDWWQGR